MFTVFSGGTITEKGSSSHCITVMQGKTVTVLEMEYPVVDFILLCQSPWPCELQDPYAVAVLLQNDFVVIDLLTPGFPCFESPYPMDLHESPVTCCAYLIDCPSDLVPAFYSIGRHTVNRRTIYSQKDWPISGGAWSPVSCSYSEIVITGHQDGSLRFWDSGAGTLQILYKLKTAKIFEKSKCICNENLHPLAIQHIYLCPQSRRLCTAGSMGQLLSYKFRKSELMSETIVLEIPILYENIEDFLKSSPGCDLGIHQLQKLKTIENEKREAFLKVKSGIQRKLPGLQCQMVCFATGPNRQTIQITATCINSCYGLMCFGTENGVVVIDIIQKICLLSITSPDLYGAYDPHSRTSRSPKNVEAKDEQGQLPCPEKVWTEWKSDIKKKLAHNKVEARATGGGPYSKNHLTSVEEDIVRICAIAKAVEGVPGQSLGFCEDVVEDIPEPSSDLLDNAVDDAQDDIPQSSKKRRCETPFSNTPKKPKPESINQQLSKFLDEDKSCKKEHNKQFDKLINLQKENASSFRRIYRGI